MPAVAVEPKPPELVPGCALCKSGAPHGHDKITDAYKPYPKQIAFHQSDAKYRLNVGGFGSGKSKSLLWEAMFHCLEFPGSNSIILRKTIPDLKRTVIDKFLSDVPGPTRTRRGLYQSYNQSDHIVYFHPDPVTGLQSKLYLAACERDVDVGKFLSTEYVFIGFEELGEFSFFVWDAMRGRNRCPIKGSRSCMAGATNPMGIGWGWIKRLWVDKVPFTGMDPELYDPNDYELVHSTVDDNPTYANNREYIKTLESSPRRDIIRWGKLDTVSGQYFDNWDYGRHVQPASAFTFQYWQPTWIGWDYGFGHYACIVFFTKAIYKDGLGRSRVVNVAVRELTLHECTPIQQVEALIASIPRAEDGIGYTENVENIYFSWERFNRTVSQHTVADEVGDALQAAGLPRPQRSNSDRIAGWQKIYDLLDVDEFYVVSSPQDGRGCPVLAESIPLLVRNPQSLEDVLKPKGVSLSDDMGDACRYGIAGALIDPEDKPADVKLREKLAAIEDPMRRHIEAMRDYHEKNAQAKQVRQKFIPTWQNRLK
jgi:hypothetical protein